MTDNEWGMALFGEGTAEIVVDGRHTRLRYVVADAVSARARERQQEGRPDKAGLLRYIASEIERGGCPSKKSMGKARTDLAIVRERLVDAALVDSSDGHDAMLGVQERDAQLFLLQRGHLDPEQIDNVFRRPDLRSFVGRQGRETPAQLQCRLEADRFGVTDAAHARQLGQVHAIQPPQATVLGQ